MRRCCFRLVVALLMQIIYSGCAIVAVPALNGKHFYTEEGMLAKAKKENHKVKRIKSVKQKIFGQSVIEAEAKAGIIFCDLNSVFPFDYSVTDCVE